MGDAAPTPRCSDVLASARALRLFLASSIAIATPLASALS